MQRILLALVIVFIAVAPLHSGVSEIFAGDGQPGYRGDGGPAKTTGKK